MAFCLQCTQCLERLVQAAVKRRLTFKACGKAALSVQRPMRLATAWPSSITAMA